MSNSLAHAFSALHAPFILAAKLRRAAHFAHGPRIPIRMPCGCLIRVPRTPVDSSECTIHIAPRYSCRASGCSDYRPKGYPFLGSAHYPWPRCVCGELAEMHDGEER